MMKKEKNQFRVSIELSICSVIVLLIGIGIMIFVGFNIDKEELYLLPILIIMLIILPLVICIWGAITMFPIITFDDKGIHKKLFNRYFPKTILWEDLYQIRIYNTAIGAEWVFFSTVDISNYGLNKVNKNKNVINILKNKRIMEIISEFTDIEPYM